MLLPRILTAIIAIPIIIYCIHLGGVVYMAFVGVVIFLCLYEYWLVLRLGKRPLHIFSLLFFGAVTAVTAVLSRNPLIVGHFDNLVPFAISLTILGVLTIEVITPRRSIERMAFTFLGVFLIPWNLSYLVNLRDISVSGMQLTYMLFITVWTADTGAYFAGKLFGRHKLTPEVSPQKTWEGAIAGLLTAILVSIWLKSLFKVDITTKHAAVLGVVVTIAGQISDLAESIIKRSSKVKDSSNLLPGHGGVLDRFDSFLLLAPIYYYAYVFWK
jgi:phosphatidate cytidylyltransferase